MLMTWIRRWVYAGLLLGAFAAAAWWFVQQTSSYTQLETLIHRHPVVAAEVGDVSSIRLPFFGYGLDVTEGRVDPDFNVHVRGSKGEALVHAQFVDGGLTDAFLVTDEGHAIPLVVKR